MEGKGHQGGRYEKICHSSYDWIGILFDRV